MHRLVPTSDLSPFRHPFSTTSVSNHSKSTSVTAATQSPGAFVLSHWIPFDIWPRIAIHLETILDQAAFQNVCRAAYTAINLLHASRHRIVQDTFHLSAFQIPQSILHNVLMVHVVPPKADSLILFLDESDSGSGVNFAWLKAGRLQRINLGLTNVHATTVSNILFSPDSSRIAFLVTLAHGAISNDHVDPLHRLRGWERVRRTRGNIYDILYDPCADCTVQIIDLEHENLRLHTFSHVFVPEYGFDMVWRTDPLGNHELAFAAMLHSAAGAATYLVRWRNFALPNLDNFVFMACIDGVSIELLRDKRNAMSIYDSTKCTSRIEISDDAKAIFFDTTSKFGILRFDQIVNANTARVTRADLPNNFRSSSSRSSPSKLLTNKRSTSTSSSCESSCESSQASRHAHDDNACLRHALRQLNIGNPYAMRKRHPSKWNQVSTRISRMSPDGSLLCSVICEGPTPCPRGARPHSKCVEMRLSHSGQLVYRKKVTHRCKHNETELRFFTMPYEKSADVAQQSLTFSADSQLLILWDTQLSRNHVVYSYQLPLVLDAQTGKVIQSFAQLSSLIIYEFLQASPDGLTLYGSRMLMGKIVMDAIDVLSGSVLKTVIVTGSVLPPPFFSAHSNFLLRQNMLHSVSRGRVDALWQTTRGALGCGWSARQRLDEHEAYGDLYDDGHYEL